MPESMNRRLNYADVFDRVAAVVSPDTPAIICDSEVTPWREFEARATSLASALLRRGLQPESKVALYMRNGPDYLIGFYACLKARLVSANINFRYGPSEIDYLLDNSDAEAVLFDAEFFDTLQKTTKYANLTVQASSRSAVTGVTPITDLYEEPAERLPQDRSGEDIFLLYTGGTTGMPKGVMWPSGSMWEALASARVSDPGTSPADTLEALEQLISSQPVAPKYYIAPPFMHGTGLFAAISVLSRGGCVVCSGAVRFNALTTLEAISHHVCDGIVIVGDAFARPMLDALDASDNKIDVSQVTAVVSSGMMWSPDVKQGLLKHMPNAALSDGLGASEASSIAFSVTTKDSIGQAAKFAPVDALVVDPENLTPVEPGSEKVGVIAKAGPLPLGYYKDPERTARTYVEINGRTHMISGDHAKLEADGTIILLGRGNHCINTAGEKVYPEEVEEALKSHRAVLDALVFGLEDSVLGQAVTAIVSLNESVDESALKERVCEVLAKYKAPKSIAFVSAVPRAPNGKADYKRAKQLYADIYKS